MRLKELTIGKLTAQIPIIQGGMGIGVSLSGLAGAVASNGGIGVISAAQPGYDSDNFFSNPLKANLNALAYHIKKAKEAAKGGIVAVNIMYAINNYAEYVKCCVENKVDIIISGAGLPVNLPELVKGSAVKIAPIVSSVKAADILLKIWQKRYEKDADMVIVEGPKAGGHLGISLDELEKIDNGEIDYDLTVEGILNRISSHEQQFDVRIPTIFGGGIHDKADVLHYLNMGCAGVQIASRFVATEECDAHENFKLAYVNAKENDISYVKSPLGLPGRALKNKFFYDVLSKNKTVDRCVSCVSTCTPAKTPYCISRALTDSVSGRVNDGLVFCGQKVDKIKEITTVKKLLNEFL